MGVYSLEIWHCGRIVLGSVSIRLVWWLGRRKEYTPWCCSV